MYYKTLSKSLGQHAITEHITIFTVENMNSVKNNITQSLMLLDVRLCKQSFIKNSILRAFEIQNCKWSIV